MANSPTYDCVVVGAGVFGAWTAWHLAAQKQRVLLVDAYGAAHSRASSGGETRIIRMGYGADEIYTRWSLRSLGQWKALFRATNQPLFLQTGVLWRLALHGFFIADVAVSGGRSLRHARHRGPRPEACPRRPWRARRSRQDRLVSREGVEWARSFVARRFPDLKDSPIVETRVCQYENTSNGDFLADRHPDLANVWLAGGGSGHGFKHGPALGEYLAAQMNGRGAAEPRFSLATKATLTRNARFSRPVPDSAKLSVRKLRLYRVLKFVLYHCTGHFEGTLQRRSYASSRKSRSTPCAGHAASGNIVSRSGATCPGRWRRISCASGVLQAAERAARGLSPSHAAPVSWSFITASGFALSRRIAPASRICSST